MAVSAYILIHTEVGKAAQVADEHPNIDGVLSAEDVTGPNDVIVHYGVAMPSMVFYLQRHIDAAFSREQFLEMVRPPSRPDGRFGAVFGVMPEDVFEDLRKDLPPTACVLGRQPTFDAKLRQMLARRPPTPVVVMSTDCKR